MQQNQRFKKSYRKLFTIDYTLIFDDFLALLANRGSAGSKDLVHGARVIVLYSRTLLLTQPDSETGIFKSALISIRSTPHYVLPVLAPSAVS